MPQLGQRTFKAAKYAYIAGFFALLSGVFYPLVNQTAPVPTILGVITLFVGLLGGYVVYRAAVSPKYPAQLLAVGMSIIAVAVLLILRLGGTI